MNFDPLLAQPVPIPGHAFAAMAALVVGSVQLAAPKGTNLHRWTGRVWVALMAGVAISGFFIHELRLIGPFSPIHLLSVYVLISLFRAIRAVRQGDIAGHRRIMMSVYLFGLILAGVFTFLPGRAMNTVLFSG